MAKCKNCRNYDRKEKWCDLIKDSPHEDMERECGNYEKMTNADRIRSMSDEELAEFLERFGSFNQPCSINKGEPLKWLQSEVEE